jgi:hypothetical protein
VALTHVALYHATGCHLCGPARATARAVCDELGLPLVEVDIAGDDLLEARYRDALPVIEIDGARAFKFFVDEHDLRARLRRHVAR